MKDGVSGMKSVSVRITWLFLALIVLGGLALRLYGIRSESVWWDEYTSLKYLDAPSLPAFLRINHTLDPATMPVYDTFEYLWGRYVSHSPLGLRLASVGMGTLLILVMYATGELAFGPIAGLVAAACVAFSPIHRHFAQEIHMYGPVTLFAAGSLYTLLKILRGGRWPWWAAHVVINVLLMWSHTFGLLAPFAEGLFWLVCQQRPFKRLLVWCAIHGVLVVPLLIYVTGIQFWSAEQTDTWQRTPGFLEFLGDLFSDDAVCLTYQMRPSDAMHVLSLFHPVFDLAWVAAVAAAMIWGARRIPRDRRTVLLLLVFLLPPIILYTASLVWRPCIFPRYTVYCSLGLYLLLGGSIAALPRTWMRVVGSGACALILIYQTAILLPGPQRTDWLSAGKWLKSEARAEDPVLVQVAIWKDVLLFNAGELPNPVSSAETIDVLVDQAAFLLDRYGCGDAAHPCDRSVWMVVLLKYFTSGPYKELDAAIAARGLRAKTVEFQGIEHILAYQLSAVGKPVVAGKTPADAHDFMEGYGNLAVALVEHGDQATAQAAIRHIPNVETRKTFANDVYGNLLDAIDGHGDVLKSAGAVRALLEGYGYRKNNQLGLAADHFRKAIELDPGYAVAYIELGTALVRLGDDMGAIAALKQVGQLNPDVDCYGNLAVALAQRGHGEAAKDAILRIPHDGPASRFFQNVYGNLLQAIDAKQDVSRLAAAVQALLEGYAYRKDERLAEAAERFRKATELDPSYTVAFIELGSVLVRMGDGDGASAALRQVGMLNPMADCYGNLAVALARQGRGDAAKEAILRMPDVNSPGTFARDVYGDLLRTIDDKGDVPRVASAVQALLDGYALRDAGKFELAAASFQKATELDDRYALAFAELGMALNDTGQRDEAVAPLRRSGELAPDFGIRYGRLADVLAAHGDPAPTRQAMDLFLTGLGQFTSGKLEEARKIFDEARQKDPQYALSYLCLALTDLRQDHVPECRANLDKAFDIDPARLGTWRPFMVALFDTKDYNAAWEELHRIEAAGGSISASFVERLQKESGRER